MNARTRYWVALALAACGGKAIVDGRGGGDGAGSVGATGSGACASGAETPKLCVDVCTYLDDCFTGSTEHCAERCAKRLDCCDAEHDAYLACIMESAGTCDFWTFLDCTDEVGAYVFGNPSCSEDRPYKSGCDSIGGEVCACWALTLLSNHRIDIYCPGDPRNGCDCLLDGQLFGRCAEQDPWCTSADNSCCFNLALVQNYLP